MSFDGRDTQLINRQRGAENQSGYTGPRSFTNKGLGRAAAASTAGFGSNAPDSTPLSTTQVNAKRVLIVAGLLFMAQNPQFAATALITLATLVRQNVNQNAQDAGMTLEEYINTTSGYAGYVWQLFYNYWLQYTFSLLFNIALSLSMEFIYIAIKHPKKGLVWYNNPLANVVLVFNFLFWPLSGLTMGILAGRAKGPEDLCVEPLYSETDEELFGSITKFAYWQTEFWFGPYQQQVYLLTASILGSAVMMVTPMFKRLCEMQLAFLAWARIIKLDETDQERVMNTFFGVFATSRYSPTALASYVLDTLTAPELTTLLTDKLLTPGGRDELITDEAAKGLLKGSHTRQGLLNVFHNLFVLIEKIVIVSSFLVVAELAADFLSDSIGEAGGQTLAFLANFTILISIENFANAAAETHAYAMVAFFRALILVMQGKKSESRIVMHQAWLLFATIPLAFLSALTTSAASAYNAVVTSVKLHASPIETAANELLARIATGDFNGIGGVRSGVKFLKWAFKGKKKEWSPTDFDHTYAYDLVGDQASKFGEALARHYDLTSEDIRKLAGMSSLIIFLGIISFLVAAFTGLTATGIPPVELNQTLNTTIRDCFTIINGSSSFVTTSFESNVTTRFYNLTGSTTRPQIDAFFDPRALWYPVLSSMQMVFFAIFGLTQNSHGFRPEYMPYAVVNTLVALVLAALALVLMNRLSSYVTGGDFGPIPLSSGTIGAMKNALFSITTIWTIMPVMTQVFVRSLLPKGAAQAENQAEGGDYEAVDDDGSPDAPRARTALIRISALNSRVNGGADQNEDDEAKTEPGVGV